MRIDGQRRSDNVEDRGGRDVGGGGAGGVPLQALAAIVGRLGLRGTLLIGAVLGVGYLFMPASLRTLMLSALSGSAQSTSPGARGATSVCKLSPENAAACDFSSAILASTEDVWTAQFQAGKLPRYASNVAGYAVPRLVLFTTAVATEGCGNASSSTGPFYCPADRKLYVDPSFYQEMESHLHAPGDFAQAYVIAHEVGHHVQSLLGATRVKIKGESQNQGSVRIELQADCLAGVWGHSARASLEINDEDLAEALNAAHAIGDDTLGHANEREFTHGSSAQRMRWFRRGFDSGDARQCDTLAVSPYSQL
jgi:predicted metalloprotease